jgi:NitT/TauT family transport system permease protein
MTMHELRDVVASQKKNRSIWSNHIVLGAVPFVVAGLIWETIGRLEIQSLRYVIPTPEAVAAALWHDISTGAITEHFFVTMTEVFTGLAIAIVLALVLGIIIGRSIILEQMLYPFIVFFQAVPKVALAPLWLIAFGFGMGSKIALATMVCFFPMLVGVVVGMAAMRREELELMRSLRASSWQIFVKVQLLRALPSIFGGLEVAVLFSLIGAIVGEFVGAQAGLGYLIEYRSSRLDLPGVFSPLVILAVVGVVLDGAVKFLGRRLITWSGQ